MKSLSSLLLACVAWAILSNAVLANEPRLPNVLLILADDLGWADLGCYGADLHETPHLDRFATDACRFTDAYAMSVCSPSRASLMTGKHAARLHFTIWAEGAEQGGPKNRKLLQADSIWNLPHTETTLATHLQQAGYRTAMIGKWHIGDWRHAAETHGFDINIGGTNWGAPQTFWWPYRGRGRFGDAFRYVPGLGLGTSGEYLTDRLTDEAIKTIDAAGDQPWFVYLSHHSVHTPIEAHQADVDHFDAKIRPSMHHQHGVYAAMVKNLDDNVGRVLEHLETRGLQDNTIVVFTSDNGGYVGSDTKSGRAMPVTNNAPLRSGKGSLYEGGIRVPLLIRWPGVTGQGSTCSEPVVLTDLFSTLLAAARHTPTGVSTDSHDLRPLLDNPAASLDRDALTFHYPHYYATTTPVSAIRAGKWKLFEYFEDSHLELYDLTSDLAEERNLAESHADVAKRLHEQLRQWRNDVDAHLPRPNGDFHP
jgi:arylsulfatase A